VFEVEFLFAREGEVFLLQNGFVQSGRNQIFNIVSSLDERNGEIFGFDEIHHGRNSENRIEFVFSPKAFFDDVHMKHSEESTAKTESQRSGIFHFVFNGTIIEREFF
jgi:hypothetical protein